MKLELTAMGTAIGVLAGLLIIRHLTFAAAYGWALQHRAIMVLAVGGAVLVIACARFVAVSTSTVYRRAK